MCLALLDGPSCPVNRQCVSSGHCLKETKQHEAFWPSFCPPGPSPQASREQQAGSPAPPTLPDEGRVHIARPGPACPVSERPWAPADRLTPPLIKERPARGKAGGNFQL